MVSNATLIVLTLLTHVAFISTSGIHQFNVNGNVFYSDFYIMSGGGEVIVDGTPVIVNLPVNYNQTVLKNATMNLITLIDYLQKNDPLLTAGDSKTLQNTRSLLISMLQSNAFETTSLTQSENIVVNIYLKSLSKMRADRSEALREIKSYVSLLSSPGIPVKLQNNAEDVKKRLKSLYSVMSKYDYGIAYFYDQLYPEYEGLIKEARFIASYPEVYRELTAIKNTFSYLDSEGLLDDEMKTLWLNKFSPMYVKFVRGIYVNPNVTVMEQTLMRYLNDLKEEAKQNLLKAKTKLDSYTNPPFYQKGSYEKKIEELQSTLDSIEFKKFDNTTVENVKTLVKVYKESERLPAEMKHKYIIDIILTVVVMGAIVGILLARFTA